MRGRNIFSLFELERIFFYKTRCSLAGYARGGGVNNAYFATLLPTVYEYFGCFLKLSSNE